MKTIKIETTWRSVTDVEVPDDFVLSGNLLEVPYDVLEQLDSSTAELVDWSQI